MQPYARPQQAILAQRLQEPRRFIQVVAGPRQVGKTTLVTRALKEIGSAASLVSADGPTLRDPAWVSEQWEIARVRARETGSAILALDEVQKIANWSEIVKRHWDEDTRSNIPLRVVLLGSAPLLIQQGLTESLAGRFEIIRVPHWSFAEMRDAFGFDLEQYIYFGGYPGGASLAGDPARWGAYIRDSLIETTISRDVLLLSRVDKPALLRRLFELACRYSGQIVSYSKLVGELADAGNTTTLAHYLDLLAGAGMVTGLQKYSGSVVRRRASSPKLQVLNTALMTAQSDLSPEALAHAPDVRGRVVESAIGAHLVNAAAVENFETFYWRDGGNEVDFVLTAGKQTLAIEVKSGMTGTAKHGMSAFLEAYPRAKPLLVGGDGVPIEEFLSSPVRRWLA
jgi:predicted AAA+ superfamily ATPase